MGINPETQNPDGTFLPGVSGNPSGRPDRKEFTKLLHKIFPDETILFQMMSELYGVDTNFATTKDVLKLIEDPSVKKRFRKYLNKIEKGKGPRGERFRTKLNNRDRILILQWLFEQKYGKAQQFTTTEITTPEDRTIKVEFVKSEKEDDDDS